MGERGRKNPFRRLKNKETYQDMKDRSWIERNGDINGARDFAYGRKLMSIIYQPITVYTCVR